MVVRRARVDGLRLDPQGSTGPWYAGPEPRPPTGTQHGSASATGKAADLFDRGDHAVRRVAVGQSRRQQQPPVRTGLGRIDDRAAVAVELHRHDHAGQHHEIGQGQQRQRDDISHVELLGFLSL